MGEQILEIVLGIFRFLFGLIVEDVGEFLLKFLICGPGYLIGRYVLRCESQELEDFSSFVLGLLFWAIVIYVIWKGWPWQTGLAK